MTDKCAICNNPLEVIFLEKINGTYLRDAKGKKRAVCSVCQKNHAIATLRTKV
jgi:Zn-finger protein